MGLKKWFDNNLTFVFFTICGLLLILIGLLFPKIMPLVNKPEPVFQAAKITVDLAGAVAKPGVYQVEEGTRLESLVARAGGVTSQADQDWIGKNLNQAQVLKDEDKIYLPKTGEIPPDLASLKKSGNTVLGVTNSVNINTCNEAELDQLPGVGPVTAAKIIQNRPYSKIEDLLSKKAVPKSTFTKIQGLIKV